MLVVPFVDVVATMSDPKLPATVMEYEVLLALLALCTMHSRTSLLVDSSHARQIPKNCSLPFNVGAGAPLH